MIDSWPRPSLEKNIMNRTELQLTRTDHPYQCRHDASPGSGITMFGPLISCHGSLPCASAVRGDTTHDQPNLHVLYHLCLVHRAVQPVYVVYIIIITYYNFNLWYVDCSYVSVFFYCNIA